MNKQSNDTRTPLLLHAARLVFPPLAALVVLGLTEWIARGTLDADTFAQYIGPHWEAYALAWALLFLVWLTVDWLTRFSPLATLVTAILGCVPAAGRGLPALRPCRLVGRPVLWPPRRKLPFKHKRTRACARVFYASYYRAFLAVSTRALKLAGSWMAISLSILRFSSMPDFFRPFMKVE